MLSVFQVFRIVIGSVVFLFVLMFFLRVGDMYSFTQEKSQMYDVVLSFDRHALSTYTSGNPVNFSGFHDFDSVVYHPPKLKSGAGEKTLSVPVLMIPSKDELWLERRCKDYGWFKWCWVYAVPESVKVIFSPLENSPRTRNLTLSIIKDMPSSVEFGVCNGSAVKAGDSAEFTNFVQGTLSNEAVNSYIPCRVIPSETTKIVVLSGTADIPLGAMQVDPSLNRDLKINTTDGIIERDYSDYLDIVAFIIGGVHAYDYKNDAFSSDLSASTEIMYTRTILVLQNMPEYNRQPCIECATPFERACGWTHYDGTPYESKAYRNFRISLQNLKNSIQQGNYQDELIETAQIYNLLKRQGCE